MNIPYTVEERPDTGLANGKLGIWLFLASEVMLFGALFSTYIILRTGATECPHGELNVWLGMINTFILIGSSVTMVMAWASLKLNDFPKHRLYLISTVALSAVFLVVKYFEYSDHFARGEGPWHNTFLATYFTGLLAGALGVLIVSPLSPTAGASGAIFGLLGAAFVEAHRRGIEAVRNQLVILIVINLIITISIPGISIGGHIGGLIGGGLATLAFQQGGQPLE